ncbi:MAG: LCP family protein [Mogibacterium sp.]|nr:LCP family protein [Mogibacterium sp.]
MSDRRIKDLDELLQVPDFQYAEKEPPVELPDSRLDESLNKSKQSRQEKKQKKQSQQKKKSGSSASEKKERRRNSKFYKFTRILSYIYLAMFVIFAIVMKVMDVLPTGTYVAIMIVLALLSAVLFIQLFFKKIKLWAKIVATFLSIVLIFVYGIGSAYALGTLAFLDTIGSGVKNENRVNVRTEPFNILISGIDQEGEISTPGLSDVNMLVTVNPKTGKILLTSVPRDYQIRIIEDDHVYGYDKLTHTGSYGIDTTIAAVEDLLDVQVNYYVKVNFATVVKFVDAIGGVDVYSDYEFVPVKMPSWTVQQGMNHMNGSQALCFARERKAFNEGDVQRIKNQQAVFEAMFKKALSSKVLMLSYMNILDELTGYVEMNMSSGEIRSLVKMQIAKNIKWDIQKNNLTGHDRYMGTVSTGSTEVYVMGQDEDSVNDAKAKIQAVLSGEK